MVTMANRKALRDGYRFLVVAAAVILCFGGLSVSQAGTYYVATTGNNNNPGTEALPWRTVQKAASTIGAGDTAYIRAGRYHEHVVVTGKRGTEVAPVVFASYPTETAIVDCNGLGGFYGVFEMHDCNWVEVRGLRVENCNGSGIWMRYSDQMRVEDCYTFNTTSSGIKVRYTTNAVVKGNEIVQACLGGSEECITVKQFSEWILVEGNHIHDCMKEGIDIKEGARNVQVIGNHIHDIERQGLYADAWNVPTFNIEYRNNIIHDCGFGLGACAETSGVLSNVWFVNNLIYNCAGPGMFCKDWGGDVNDTHPIVDVYYINNTVFNCAFGWGAGVDIGNTEAQNVVVRNNILSQCTPPIQVNRPPISYTIEYNLTEDTTGLDPNWCIEGLPRFVNAAAGDFHIQGDSDAIDAGSATEAPATDLEDDPRPMGWGYDIGAYEWPLGDIDGSGHVEYADVWLLSEQWLGPGGSPSADIWPLGGDGVVDWLDFAELGKCWAK